MFSRFSFRLALKHCPDGASNTLLLGESLPGTNAHLQKGWYTSYGSQLATTIIPINWPVSDTDTSWCGSVAGPAYSMYNNNVAWGFRSRHLKGSNFTFVDGSVHFLNQSIDHKTFQLLGCRNDNQPMNGNW